jgi:hypothetical protein
MKGVFPGKIRQGNIVQITTDRLFQLSIVTLINRLSHEIETSTLDDWPRTLVGLLDD